MTSWLGLQEGGRDSAQHTCIVIAQAPRIPSMLLIGYQAESACGSRTAEILRLHSGERHGVETKTCVERQSLSLGFLS